MEPFLNKQDLVDKLNTSWELPGKVAGLKALVDYVEWSVEDETQKEIMYQLIGTILDQGERIHALEARMIGWEGVHEDKQRMERIRIERQQSRREGVANNEAYYTNDPDKVKEWKF